MAKDVPNEPWVAHDDPNRSSDRLTWLCDCALCAAALGREAQQRPRLELCIKTLGRLAPALGLPVHEVVAQTRPNQRQKLMQNSAQQLANVAGTFAVSGRVPRTPVLLVDDIVDSRWTLTQVGTLLREAGSGGVVPLTLAYSGPS